MYFLKAGTPESKNIGDSKLLCHIACVQQLIKRNISVKNTFKFILGHKNTTYYPLFW